MLRPQYWASLWDGSRVLTAGGNQASSFSISPPPPHLPTSCLPSLSPSLSLRLSFPPRHPQLCPEVRSLLESLDAECAKRCIGKSQPGKVAKGLPPQHHSGQQATLRLQHQQVWSGGPGSWDPLSGASLETVYRRVPQTEGLCGPLRASAALLCQTDGTCCRE